MSSSAPRPRPSAPRRLGPFRVGAEVASTRRAQLVLARRDDAAGPWLVREPLPRSDPDAIREEHERSLLFDASLDSRIDEHQGVLLRSRRPILGESLATILDHQIRVGEPMRPDLAIALIRSVAAKLPTHDAHGDLAPHHVFFGYDGVVHVIDPVLTDWLERASQPSRLGYRSPEHVGSGSLEPSSDVFVLAILFFELTTARRLFSGDSRPAIDSAIAEGRVPRARAIVPSYPVELQAILRQGLKVEPDGRYAHGPALADALAQAAQRFGSTTPQDLGRWLESRFATGQADWNAALAALPEDAKSKVSVPPPLPGGKTPSRASKAPEPPPLRRSNPAPVRAERAFTLEDLDRLDAEGAPAPYKTPAGFALFADMEAPPEPTPAPDPDGLDLDSAFGPSIQAPTPAKPAEKAGEFDDEHTLEETAPAVIERPRDLVADLLGASDESEDVTTDDRITPGDFSANVDTLSDEDEDATLDGPMPALRGEADAESKAAPHAPAPRKIRARTSSVLKALSRDEVDEDELENTEPPHAVARAEERSPTPASGEAPDPEKAFLEAMKILENKRKERERAETPVSPASSASPPPSPQAAKPAALKDVELPARSPGRRESTLIVRPRNNAAKEDAASTAETLDTSDEESSDSLVVPVVDETNQTTAVTPQKSKGVVIGLVAVGLIVLAIVLKFVLG